MPPRRCGSSRVRHRPPLRSPLALCCVTQGLYAVSEFATLVSHSSGQLAQESPVTATVCVARCSSLTLCRDLTGRAFLGRFALASHTCRFPDSDLLVAAGHNLRKILARLRGLFAWLLGVIHQSKSGNPDLFARSRGKSRASLNDAIGLGESSRRARRFRARGG